MREALEKADDLRDRVLDLEAQLEERDQRIVELEDQLRGERIRRDKLMSELLNNLKHKVKGR